jgi:hypothetical protein
MYLSAGNVEFEADDGVGLEIGMTEDTDMSSAEVGMALKTKGVGVEALVVVSSSSSSSSKSSSSSSWRAIIYYKNK